MHFKTQSQTPLFSGFSCELCSGRFWGIRAVTLLSYYMVSEQMADEGSGVLPGRRQIIRQWCNTWVIFTWVGKKKKTYLWNKMLFLRKKNDYNKTLIAKRSQNKFSLKSIGLTSQFPCSTFFILNTLGLCIHSAPSHSFDSRQTTLIPNMYLWNGIFFQTVYPGTDFFKKHIKCNRGPSGTQVMSLMLFIQKKRWNILLKMRRDTGNNRDLNLQNITAQMSPQLHFNRTAGLGYKAFWVLLEAGDYSTT